MIGKIVKGSSFKGCISYVLGDKEAKILAAEGVLATDTKSIINSFYMQSLLNPKLSKCVGHIPLAFSPDDKERMTDQFMERLAKEYMQAMGIKNTQYLIVRHSNTSHPHLHIVFNRVDYDGKTISDKNDQYRNGKVCKLLKDKHNLTYGKGKENVNIEKLKGAEQTKYEVYHAVKLALPKAKSWQQFESLLDKQEISIEYKHKGQTEEVQGISFKKGKHSFKGSGVDRKFSFGNLKKEFQKNIIEENKRIEEAYSRQQAEQKAKQEAEEKATQQTQSKPELPSIGGVELMSEQWQILKEGGHIYLENINRSDGSGKFSSYVFLNEEKE